MRRTFIIATTTAGVLSLGGLAVAVPALADPSGTAATGVERITEALSGLVSDGSITQEQADEVASTLRAAGIGDRGGHGGGRVGFEAAATALDMTEDELRSALATEGTSLADVAEAQGVAVGALVGALVTAAQEHIARAVEDGDLTQEQADGRLADLEERITQRVDSDGPEPGHGPGGRGYRPSDGSSRSD